MPLAAELAAAYRVGVVDLPGFGLSGDPGRTLTLPELADWMADWLPVAEVGPVVLGGNSFGCQVATEIAVRHPGLVRCLVLATSFSARPQPGRPADRLGKRADQSLVVTGCRAR